MLRTTGGWTAEQPNLKQEQQARRAARGTNRAPLPLLFNVFLAATEGKRSDLSVPARSLLFRQGDESDAVFYVKSGRIQLAVLSAQGKEGVIAIFGPGDFFGEGCLSDQRVRLASASATTASTVARIDKETMTRLLREQPAFSQYFVAFLISRTIQVEGDLVDQLFNSSEKRLARLLLSLADFGRDGELRPIVPKVSQEVLAARVGTTRSRVNFFLNKFRKLGMIEYNGSMKVKTALLDVFIHNKELATQPEIPPARIAARRKAG